jgi:hypothetical protein
MKSSSATAPQRTQQDEIQNSQEDDAASSSLKLPSREEQTRIEQVAYGIYVERGRIDGRALDDWLEVESIVWGDRDDA